ncbi:hypothetical protein C0995_006469 [Termitomyces sp. Mi166|nr:hypothetical protein C0995_006469 [Termitomyces sp. Mi166\
MFFSDFQATDALNEIDFTPETFKKDSEKGNIYRSSESARHFDEKQILSMITEIIKQPQIAHKSPSESWRGQSIYSERDGTPLKFSSTPSLFQERDWAAAEARSSVRKTNTFGRNHLNLGNDENAQPQMPPKSATVDTPRSTTSPRSRRSRDLTYSPNSSFASPMPSFMFSRPTTPVAPPGFHPPF